MKFFEDVKTIEEINARKEEFKKILQEEEYGYLPEAPLSVEGKVLSKAKYCAGRAFYENIELTIKTRLGDIILPVIYCYKKDSIKKKTLVTLNFDAEVPNKYLLAEEILDNGWNFVAYNYQNITIDPAREQHWYTEAYAPMLRELSNPKAPAGKLMMWAWGAMRVLDYMLTREEVDPENVAVTGHSRMGKTALICGGFDERFKFVHSNDSGIAGASQFRMINEKSEDVKFMYENVPYWFTDKYFSYIGKEHEMPFDQHYLLGLIAPRPLSVHSAVGDLWSNPDGELESCKLATKAWNAYGKKGLIMDGELEIGKKYFDGLISYHRRPDGHYFSREDWNVLLKFFDKYIDYKV